MKNYSKVGNRKGRPAYRTPAGFRYRSYLKILRKRHAPQAHPQAENIGDKK